MGKPRVMQSQGLTNSVANSLTGKGQRSSGFYKLPASGRPTRQEGRPDQSLPLCFARMKSALELNGACGTVRGVS